ncbi:MAG: site-specific integrase [Ruminococcus sp.]|nr:site-specific integrase [Ruminococcus sp.]
MADINTRKRGNKWEYRFEGAKINGKRNQITKGGFSTKKDALIAGTKALAEYNESGIKFIPSEISFSDYLDFWIKEYCKVNLKPVTVTNYEKKIRLHVKPQLGMYKLKNISPATLQSLINKLFNEGYSRNTLLSIKGILSGSLDYAVEPMKFIAYNPMRNVKLPLLNAKPKIPTRNKERQYISKEDMEIILERFPIGTTAHIPLLLGYRCGLRIGEAFAITWEDIDFEKKTLSINKQMQWKEKDEDTSESYWYLTAPKYNSVRTIDLDDDTISILQQTQERQLQFEKAYKEYYSYNYADKQNQRLNTNGDGTILHLVNIRENGMFVQPRIMQHTSHIIRNKLGINFDFHSLRHTHCTVLAEQGVSVKYAQERLGHKNINVTLQVYQHVTSKMKDDNRAILNKIF